MAVNDTETVAPPELITAVKAGDIEAVKAFLDQGIDVNIKSKNKSTMLLIAAISDQLEMARFLVERNATLDDRNAFSHTVLICVARLSRYGATKDTQNEMAQLLVDAGASLDEQDDHGRTALDNAVEMSNHDLIKILKDAADLRSLMAEQKAEAKTEQVKHLAAAENQKRLKENKPKFKLKAGPAL